LWDQTTAPESKTTEAVQRGTLPVLAMEKDYLLLKRASAFRPSGEWSDDDYDVLAEGVVVGRIFKANAAPVGQPWMWTLAHGREAQGGANGPMLATTVSVPLVLVIPRCLGCSGWCRRRSFVAIYSVCKHP
jgi:hypothetical protein